MNIKIEEGFPEVGVIIRCPQNSDDIQKMQDMLQGFDKKLTGCKDGKTYIIDRKDVLYFESVDKRCFIYTAGDVYETPLRLYEIEEWLTGEGFFRCSKSQIANIAKFESLCPDFGGRMDVTLVNGEKLIVSRQYAKLLRERLKLK